MHSAISLGLVGRALFSRRVGRNAAFSHSGNLTTALFAGVVGASAGQQWIFYVSAALGAVVILFSLLIRNEEIDNDAASERTKDNDADSKPVSDIFSSTRMGLFALLVVIFHFANAAMLPLAGQELGKAVHGKSSVYMAACIVVAQLVMVPTAYLSAGTQTPGDESRFCSSHSPCWHCAVSCLHPDMRRLILSPLKFWMAWEPGPPA